MFAFVLLTKIDGEAREAEAEAETEADASKR